jgi:uncharacterized MAPEG superfamily protein
MQEVADVLLKEPSYEVIKPFQALWLLLYKVGVNTEQTANGVLLHILQRLCQGVLYFENINTVWPYTHDCNFV